MAQGDVIPLVAGDPVAVDDVNTSLSNLQATMQAMPVANLANNRAPWMVSGFAFDLAGGGLTPELIYFQNLFGLDGIRLVSIQLHAYTPLGTEQVRVWVEKSATADFAAVTQMALFTVVAGVDTAEASMSFGKGTITDATIPDTWYFRVRASQVGVGSAVQIVVTALMDMPLRPKA